MNAWCFYNSNDGTFANFRFSGPERLLKENTPLGCLAIVGNYDRLSQKVDLATGEVVDYQPPQPDDDHAWNAETKRWQLKPEVVERNSRRATAQSELEALDPKELRAISDLMADPTSKAAMDRLTEIRAQKDVQREKLK